MGGRGATSGTTKIASYEELTRRQENIKYFLNMQKVVNIHEKGYVPRTSKYKDVDYSKIDEAIVSVPMGYLEKRKKMLKEKGYNIIAQTKVEQDTREFDPIKIHIKRSK